MASKRCTGRNKEGERCKMMVGHGNTMCWRHKANDTSLPPPFRLENVITDDEEDKMSVVVADEHVPTVPSYMPLPVEDDEAFPGQRFSTLTKEVIQPSASQAGPSVSQVGSDVMTKEDFANTISQVVDDLSAKFETQCRMLHAKIKTLENKQHVPTSSHDVASASAGDTSASKPKRKVKNFVSVAKRLYYHEQKDSDAVKKVLREKLQSCSLYSDDKNIPWSLVKQWTDFMFTHLTEPERDMYMNMAMYTHKCSNA